MNRGAIGILASLLLVAGCVSPPFPQSSLTGRLVEVTIGESISPAVVTAKQGDEVRWVNTTGQPVDISFVESLDGRVSCQKGFVSTGWGYLFGSTELDFLVIATVHANEWASLCFAHSGKYAYTVQLGKAAPGHARNLTGSVTIE